MRKHALRQSLMKSMHVLHMSINYSQMKTSVKQSFGKTETLRYHHALYSLLIVMIQFIDLLYSLQIYQTIHISNRKLREAEDERYPSNTPV